MTTEPKYKVGDKVILTRDVDLLSVNGVCSSMAGKTVEITECNGFSSRGCHYYTTTCGWRILETQIVSGEKVDNWKSFIEAEND